MKKQFSTFYFMTIIVVLMTTTGVINNHLGYMNGQRDALRGIYKIDQTERDYLDPEGARHILAQH